MEKKSGRLSKKVSPSRSKAVKKQWDLFVTHSTTLLACSSAKKNIDMISQVAVVKVLCFFFVSLTQGHLGCPLFRTTNSPSTGMQVQWKELYP